jgi:DNA-binding MarR family transcriptional regulator
MYTERNMDEVEKKIQQWAVQMPDLDTKSMAITSRILRMAKYINDQLSESIRRHGLTSAGFDVLATLLRSGSPYALTPNQLIEQMLITSGTMTSRINLLEKEQLVKRVSNTNDKRSVTVQLTPVGLSLIKIVIVEHTEYQTHIMSTFTDIEQNDITGLLSKYLERINY